MSWIFDEKKFRTQVKKSMKRQALSYRWVCRTLPMSHMTLQRIAEGKTLPDMRQLISICDRFGYAPVEFFDEKEYQKELPL